MNIFNTETIPLMKSALSAYTMRQSVTANNIANVTTPGYQRQEVVFEEKLQEAVSKLSPTKSEHNFIDGSQIQPEIVLDSNTALVNGINNVDIDQEMAGEGNAIKYQAVVQALVLKYRIVSDAIRGR